MSKILYIGAAEQMSYEEKGQVVYLGVTTTAYAAYLFLILRQLSTTPVTEIDYQPILIATIMVAIAAAIVGRIAVEMIRPSDTVHEDVRDREIGRFGEYVAGLVLGIGMVVPFILAIVEADYFWIANAMYLVFTLQAIVGAVIKLVAYRRGF
jgi:hypothetical protein